MVDFKKMNHRMRIRRVERVEGGRSFVSVSADKTIPVGHLQSTATPGEWSHADTDRLAKFFGFAGAMFDELRDMNLRGTLSPKGVELLKRIDSECFGD